MSAIPRRGFLLSVAAAGAFAGRVSQAPAQESLSSDVTRRLARYIVTAKPQGLPDSVRREARRTLLNWVGCALGGAQNEAVSGTIQALAPFSGASQATVFGRRERFDILNAAMINGISSHVLDFDDAHPTIIHPAAPVVPVVLALSELRPVSGSEFVNALVLGVETECRIGNAVYPAHYDAGWHITGTTGVFGAAAAAGKLLGLSEQQMVWALGLAAAQPVGLQEMFATMTKSFHAGRAAHNGLTAALLAQRNFTSSNQAIEGKYGWANVMSTARDYGKITDKLGQTFEINVNTYKPFATGIVMQALIDGCIQLHNEHHLTADKIARADVRVHPLALQLTGRKTPQTGMESKFSIYHGASVALIEGAGGLAQFSDRAVRDPAVVALRDRVTAVSDRTLHEDQAAIVITTTTGARLEKFVEHALGSLERPMSDRELEAKVSGLAAGVLGAARLRQVIDFCWNVENLPAVSVLARAGAA